MLRLPVLELLLAVRKRMRDRSGESKLRETAERWWRRRERRQRWSEACGRDLRWLR